MTDAGNATRFVHKHGDSARYCYAWRSWLLWTGTHWRRDAGDGVMRLAKETARAIYQEAALEPGENARRRILGWAARSESEPGLRRMLALAQSELPVEPAQLDADPFVLNAPNGTIDLRTGELRPHLREDLITHRVAVPYEPNAAAPTWTAELRVKLSASSVSSDERLPSAELSVSMTSWQRLPPPFQRGRVQVSGAAKR